MWAQSATRHVTMSRDVIRIDLEPDEARALYSELLSHGEDHGEYVTLLLSALGEAIG